MNTIWSTGLAFIVGLCSEIAGVVRSQRRLHTTCITNYYSVIVLQFGDCMSLEYVITT